MKRTIIKIDEGKCNGCGICASACHEGAIGMIDGKAKLLREDYCDGLGNCLPVCKANAISFEVREAPAFDRQAVSQNMQKAEAAKQEHTNESSFSRLAQWPVQIKLIPVKAPYFADADLLIAADCTAYAYEAFHRRFMEDKVTLIGCPKLDEGDYASKLTQIIQSNSVRSVTVVRMEVPCCSGIEHAVTRAVQASGKHIPLHVIIIGTNGNIIE